MKIYHKSYRGKREVSVVAAVGIVLDDSLSEGEIESIKSRLNAQEQFIGELVELLAGRIISPHELENLLGSYQFEVTEE